MASDSDVINLDMMPIVRDPERWECMEHYRGGRVVWNPDNVFPYTSMFTTERGLRAQRNIDAVSILGDLAYLPVANACLRDFLFASPAARMRKRWQPHTLHFPATILYERKGAAFIPCLFWNGEDWEESDTLLETYSEMGGVIAYPRAEPLTVLLCMGTAGFQGRKSTYEFP
ncbi:MAG: hypothetical protein WA021_06025 [Minisyncoccia bacterium]